MSLVGVFKISGECEILIILRVSELYVLEGWVLCYVNYFNKVVVIKFKYIWSLEFWVFLLFL